MNKSNVRTLIVDPALGLSGDMFLGCLIELGAGADRVTEILNTLPGLEPFAIETEKAHARGIETVRTRVTFEEAEHPRNFAWISEMIESSGMDRRVSELSLKLFRAIAEAEGRVHGMNPEDVHFHEVGAVDSIVDIVGSAAALSLLGFPKIYHQPLRLGSGTISISHGKIPLPAPATVEILKGRDVEFSDEKGEVVTPTGAALITVLAEPVPAGRIFRPKRVVYASGTRDEDENPGFLRMIEAGQKVRGSRVRVIRTTIDDMNPELYGYLGDRLFEAGAREVYLGSVIMKKGRPGVELTVICDCNIEEKILPIIFAESTTLGIRSASEERVELNRWSRTVETAYGDVEVKFRELPGGEVKFSPEYESAAGVARSGNIPVENVFRAASEAAAKMMEEKSND